MTQHWQSPVQDTTIALDGHDVQILGTSVVGAIHHGRNRQTKGHAELVTTGTTTRCEREYESGET